YLHVMEVILRDLRLENVVICKDGYVKLVDLGNSVLKSEQTRTWYEDYRPGMKKVPAQLGFRPPEVWLNEKYGPEVDWWSFGLLLYKLYSGNDCFPEEPPSQFYEEHMKRKIFDLHYDTPRWFTAADRKMFKELLMIEPKDRLGSLPEGVLAVKNHPWFRGISWISVYGGLEKKAEIPAAAAVREDPGDNYEKFPEELQDSSGVENPFPYGYQFDRF
ncbi:putative cAMP-dependent protein kinase catalytic subunit alpha, partial [Hypsibius exemplaris]